jgi:1,4-dihydroxy-2-naphthoyl-CoA hydrolase
MRQSLEQTRSAMRPIRSAVTGRVKEVNSVMDDAISVAMLNAARGGFEVALGLTFTVATADEVACEVPVGLHLLQPYGLIHGGVYASIVETLASVGAALYALPRRQPTVGLENTTSFLKAVRGGKLIGTAKPLHRGRTTQVWEVEVRGDDGELAVTCRVRMLCLEPGASIGGALADRLKG